MQGEGAEPNTSDLEKCGDLIHTAQTCNNTINDAGSEKNKLKITYVSLSIKLVQLLMWTIFSTEINN